MYSKGFISTAFITNVTSVGELKFEVATNHRTFTFRAESDGATILFTRARVPARSATPGALPEYGCNVVVTMCLHVPPVERSEWVVALEDCIRQKQQLIAISSSLIPHFEGFLEHRGLRSKIYTVVLSDKVFLFKNMEVGRRLCAVAFTTTKCLYSPTISVQPRWISLF